MEKHVVGVKLFQGEVSRAPTYGGGGNSRPIGQFWPPKIFYEIPLVQRVVQRIKCLGGITKDPSNLLGPIQFSRNCRCKAVHGLNC